MLGGISAFCTVSHYHTFWAISSNVERMTVLEHGSPHHRSLAITNLVNGLSQYASHEQSIKSVLKALKEGGPEILDKVVTRLCEPPKGYDWQRSYSCLWFVLTGSFSGRRASLVDIALSPIGSQLVGTILPNVGLSSWYSALFRQRPVHRSTKSSAAPYTRLFVVTL